MAQASVAAANPLLGVWDGPFGAPPFARIRPEHFRPAFDAALAERRGEVAAISANPAAPSFDNTIVALERCGERLSRVSATFFHLASARRQRRAGEHRARDRAGPLARARRAAARRRAVRPGRGALSRARRPWPRRRGGPRARALAHGVRARRRRACAGEEGAPGGNRRAAREPRRRLRPECARRRKGLRARPRRA